MVVNLKIHNDSNHHFKTAPYWWFKAVDLDHCNIAVLELFYIQGDVTKWIPFVLSQASWDTGVDYTQFED